MEVIYTGLRQTPEMVVNAALQEDVDAIGISILSGAHNTVFPKLIALMKEKKMDDVLLTGGDHPNANEKLINEMLQHSVKVLGKDECLDVFTHYGAMEYLKKNKPKVMYISYGETDEWAHDSNYRNYLDAAHNVDEYLQQLWNYIQSDPQYKNKTTLLITVDHGRGDANKDEWRTHGSKIMGANQIWFAVMGPNTSALGEMNEKEQLYQQQLAATMAQLMGFQFTCEHEVAPAITSVLK